MWLLSHDGMLLDGKRVWLRPGSKHLFGRVKSPSDFSYYVDTKSVSRKHLIIEVKDVEPGSGARPDQKSEIVLHDESRLGTFLDGEKLEKTKVLGGKGKGPDKYTIKLGKWDMLWRLEWHPMHIVYSSSSPKKRSGANPSDRLSATRARLEPFDIKVTQEYYPSYTTHVVANKRNTPKGLQALVNGRYVVTEHFLDALETKAAKPMPLQGAEDEAKAAPLEMDFDGNWPDEMEYVPARAKEPRDRPAELYRPNGARASVFSGYTFVLGDALQYDQLQPAITQGGGKALFYEGGIEIRSTKPEDFVRYVKSAAGERGLGQLENGSEGKGVVVVKLSETMGPDQEWIDQFFLAVDLMLGQKTIKQNQFLDAIVINDASELREAFRPTVEDDVVSSSPPAPPPPSGSVVPSQDPVASSRDTQPQMPPPSTANNPPSSEPPKATRRGFRRAITAPRFKGFDDFDPSELPKVQSVSDYEDDAVDDAVPSQSEPSQAPAGRSQLPDSSRMASQSQSQTAKGRKRRHEESIVPEDSEEEDSNDVVDKLLPAATAMKRRRLEQQLQDSAARGETPATDDSARKTRKSSLQPPSEVRKAKKEKNIDFLALAKERREKEEEEKRKDEESLREALQGMDIETMKNLAKVEDMEIRPRPARAGSAVEQNDDEDRWKPEWNGRRNFKTFRKRRHGEENEGESQAPLRGRKVIVALEEVKKKDFNMSEDYWLENETGGGKDGLSISSGRHSQSLSQRGRAGQARSQSRLPPEDIDDDEDTTMFKRTGGRGTRGSQQRSGPVQAIALYPDMVDEMEDVDPEEIAGEARNERIAAMAKGAQKARGKPTPTKTTKATKKTAGRAATKQAQRQATPLSQTQTMVGDTQGPGSTSGSGRGKRPAMAPPLGGTEPPAKRTARVGMGSEGEGSEGSGDELRFKFRRRR